MGILQSLRDELKAAKPYVIFLLLANFISSTGLVFTNKWIFTSLKFSYSPAIVCAHFVTSAIGLEVLSWFGIFQRKVIPWKTAVPLALSFFLSVITSNLSLQYSSVSFYQIAKALIPPTIFLLQTFFYGKSFPLETKYSLLLTCFGVILTSIQEVTTSFLGVIFTFTSVLLTAFYQISINTAQESCKVDSFQLLYYQLPLSGALLFTSLPIIEDLDKMLLYPMSLPLTYCLILSCAFAFSINLTTYLLIENTSVITYNISGYVKVIIIITGGMIFFDDISSPLKIIGIVISALSLLYYTHSRLKVSIQPPQNQNKSPV